ncbi:hypothetical protein [Bradyrhizobium sp. STM 3809]|uniref:hypothetical protein n=1 Tax=Bradyrhizobium sp. STM 3809 TaxID=551936 RepID=UPI00024086B3|nr:hypothetical protein [Bradyrhizobium sp. STM 3809]CCD97864.1 hypothetical protein BRAS3809_1430010 [Bradyrhizobium sp. STM 3809]
MARASRIFFGELLVETCQAERGTLAAGIREAQRTLAQSSKRPIEDKIAGLGVAGRPSSLLAAVDNSCGL